MVILITGASHTGKTVLAQKLLKKYQYPYLSIDHIKMGLIRSKNTNLTPMDDDKLTDYLWPIIREIVMTVIENHQNIIVEGCYIPYDWRKDFSDDYLSDIRFICLSFAEEYIDSHFDEIIKHGSDIEKRLDDSDCTAEWLKSENKQFIDGFQKAGEDVLIIQNDYEQVVGNLLK